MAAKTDKTAQRHELNEIDWKAEAERVNAALRDRIEDVARALFPAVRFAKRVSRSPTEIRYGKKGSLTLKTAEGKIFDSEGKLGGPPITVICAVQGCDKRGAYAWARAFLGWPDPIHESAEARDKRKAEWKAKAAERAAKRVKDDAAKEAEKAEQSALAARQWSEARSIINTPAEQYLRRRGLTDWPDDAARYHKSFRGKATIPEKYSGPAILFPVTDTRGRVVAVQAVRLTRDGCKDRAQKIVKQSVGPIGEGVLRFPGTGDLHLAEGPETALSVWQATGAPVIATLGQITARQIEAAPVPAGRALVICGDAADEGTLTATNLSKAVMAARARGVLVKLAVPDGPDGTDWNDILQRDGVAAVAAAIEAAPWTLPEGWAAASYPAPTGSVAEARAATANAFRSWSAGVLPWWVKVEADRPPAPVSLVRVPTGIGKSHAARQEAVALVRELRAAGDRRAVAIAVPTHKLGTEYLTELREIAGELGVAAYRGRKALDPDAPRELMCRRAKEAEDLSGVGGRVQTLMCKRGEIECPFFKVCGYQRQRETKADLWIVPHAALWNDPPKAIKPAALIVDENPADGAFGGFGNPNRLSLDELETPIISVDQGDGVTADLNAMTFPLARALRAMPAGHIDLRKVRAEGVTAESMAEARKTVLRFKHDLKVKPDDSDEVIAEAIAAESEHNRGVFKRARLFKGVAEALAAGLDDLPGIRRETVRQDMVVQAIRLRWRNEIAPGWAVPTILADATADPEIMRELWPALGEAVEVDAGAPHVTVRQITDYGMGEASLSPKRLAVPNAPIIPETRLKHARAMRERLRRYIEARAAAFAPGKVLLVAQKSIVARLRLREIPETLFGELKAQLDLKPDEADALIVQLREQGPAAPGVIKQLRQHGASEETLERLRVPALPENVETAHYKALAGLDHWRGVRGVVIVGRTMPSPSAVELRAEVLAGRPVRALPGWYERQPAALNVRGLDAGPTVLTKGVKGGAGVQGVDRHPDALAEALRWQVCEAELLQAIGRGRGVNRNASKPLAVDLLTNVPLPLAVDEAGPLAGFMPHPVELMMVRGVIVPNLSLKGSWGVVAAVLSDVFKSCDAARMALTRTGPYKNISSNRVQFASARVKAWNCRYAVEVRLSARTPAEAEALLARVMPGAELVAFVPSRAAEDELARQDRQKLLTDIEVEGEAAVKETIRARAKADLHAHGQLSRRSKELLLWFQTRAFEAPLFQTCVDPPPAHPRL